MKMKASYALCILLLAAPGMYADENETKIQFGDMPAKVQAAASQESKGASIHGYEKEIEKGQTYYEVQLKKDGRTKDILFDEIGAVVEIEQEVTLSDVPGPAMEGIRKQAAGAKIIKVESVTKKQTVTYEATITRGSKRSEIAVAENGSPIKD